MRYEKKSEDDRRDKEGNRLEELHWSARCVGYVYLRYCKRCGMSEKKKLLARSSFVCVMCIYI